MLETYRSMSDVTKAYIQMHISILLWGATGVLGRSIQLNEGLLVWYRLIIATASIGLYILLTNKSFRISRENFLTFFSIGTLLMVHWIFFYGAIKYSNVSVTLSLFSSTTLFTALSEPLITQKRFNKTELIYSLIAMCGIGVIFYSDENNYSTGIVLALLAAFIGAFFNILNKRVVNAVSTEVVSFYEISSGLLVLTLLLPFYIWYFQPAKLLPDVSDFFLLFILAIFCTHITLILSLKALRKLSAFTLNLSINLEPIYGIALAFIFFKENKALSTGFFTGTALILLSVAAHAYFASNAQDKPAPVNTGNL